MDKTIHDIAQDLIDNFSEDVVQSEHVRRNMKTELEESDAYYNGEFIGSKTDSLGREKHFLNISKPKVNIGKRATDIDTKHIRLRADSAKDYFKTFVANKKLQEWMKTAEYAMYLNKWGKELPKSGAAVTKYTKKGGKLNIDLMSWNRIICDTVDFYSSPVVEKVYMTPQQLKNSGYDADVVEDLLLELTTRKDENGTESNQNANFIELLEVHGEMPLSLLTDKEEDQDTYQQQMQVIARVSDGREVKDYTLYRGREAKSPYEIAYWDDNDNFAGGNGMIRDILTAQEMVNYSVKITKDQLDLANKIIFQTSDAGVANNNMITDVENGDILFTEVNKPITQLNNKADTVSAQNFKQQWEAGADNISSSFDAITGKTMPSGTPLGSVEIQNQEAHSHFEQITEMKGLYIERDMRRHIIPFLKTQLDTDEEIVASLSANELEMFDKEVVEMRIFEDAKKSLLSGKVYNKDQSEEAVNFKEELNKTGNTRFLNAGKVSWKKYFDDFEWEVGVEITGENVDKQSKMATLLTVLDKISANPALLQDPTSKTIFNKVLEMSGGLSPSEMVTNTAPVSPPAGVGTDAGITSGQLQQQ